MFKIFEQEIVIQINSVNACITNLNMSSLHFR